MSMDFPLPMEKVSLLSAEEGDKIRTVLVAIGSFNPVTLMHLRMFSGQRCSAFGRLPCGCGLYVPASDAYKKPMCNLACQTSDLVMVDPWEANQTTYQRTLTVLRQIETCFLNGCPVSRDRLKVMLVCGSDLLQSFSIPGFWIPDQVRTICREYGIVCIPREGQDVEKIITDDEILRENRIISEFSLN